MGTIVVRVDEELKQKMKAYKINVSEVVRSALKAEVEKRERNELVTALGKAKEALSRVSDEETIRAGEGNEGEPIKTKDEEISPLR